MLLLLKFTTRCVVGSDEEDSHTFCEDNDLDLTPLPKYLRRKVAEMDSSRRSAVLGFRRLYAGNWRTPAGSSDIPDEQKRSGPRMLVSLSAGRTFTYIDSMDVARSTCTSLISLALGYEDIVAAWLNWWCLAAA